MSKQNDLQHAQQLTAASFMKIFQNNTEELTRMHLDDVTELANEVARILPAGNVVTMVFSQLKSIKGKQVTGTETRQMMGLLKQGMSTFMDKAAYMTFYTTPAILISGYQTLLEAAGKDPSSAFPNGTWQFYLEFGLREDSGRHACETIGFQKSIEFEKYNINEADQLASWILASSWLVYHYEALLLQEWRERMMLRELGDYLNYPRIAAHWVERRPYRIPADCPQDYSTYRQQAFNTFIFEALKSRVREKQASKTIESWYHDETLMSNVRTSYQDQLTLLATLDPEAFSDSRTRIPLERAQIAIQYKGYYYLVPVVHNNMRLDVMTIRALSRAILDTKSNRQRLALDEFLIQIPRAEQQQARNLLTKPMQGDLYKLRNAPIILNWDEANGAQPLSHIRQGRRGIGDHALTIFRTDRSMVFDQSHIFFDAVWGMAIAEITTNYATRYAKEMHYMGDLKGTNLRPPVLDFAVDVPPEIRKMTRRSAEVTTEVTLKIMTQFEELRRLMRQRNDNLRLTVNDMLILYRAFYNQQYKPSKTLIASLNKLEKEGNRRQQKAARQALEALREIPTQYPAFLIPIDATIHDPKERIFPVTFRPQAPWTEIMPQHKETWDWLMEFQQQTGNKEKKQAWEKFSESRTRYLEMLKMFSLLMGRYKEVALAGESMSTVTLKILATVPKRLQSWLAHIPNKIDLLNDMLKGTEVFSNAGKVSEDSSLTRFITAKDDNEKKVLCWGIMTRADNTMVITLRDFRPWVGELNAAGAEDLAQMVSQDFLENYAKGMYMYIYQLNQIARAAQQ